uniref:RING-type domain-containing protein n=1 Tax=Ananas comosus var. bracteatus TaxID=296719 RepID=A0A6V7QAQ5_ANACO|nr:unnamed protein product [Ananas comosus var. bracteatus]
MADQNRDDSLSDNSQACSAASTSQPVNENEIATTRSSRFRGGTGSSLQLNENFIGQRVMNQQHQGRTAQSQSHSRDFEYIAQQRLMEFLNANRASEPHFGQASSNRLFASSNSGSQHNNQIGIAYDAWANSSNLNPGPSNAFPHGNSSNRHASGGSSLSHGHGTVMQQVFNRDCVIQTSIQSPDPVLPSLVGVNTIRMNTHITLIHRDMQTPSVLADMQTPSVLADMQTPSVHGPNLPIDVIDPFAVLTDMQGHSAHGQHVPEVILSDLRTGPANPQMYFVPGQNISRASPVVVSPDLISLQRPLHGQSSSVVVPRDRRIPTNMQRPPVSGRNLSRLVLKETDKTLIDEQGCNHQGESSSNTVPQDTKKRSIYVPKPSAHGQGLFNPLPADTNAFARESVVKSSIATQGQTSSSGQSIPLPADTNAFARGSVAKSSIAAQGVTLLPGQFIPLPADTNAFAKGSVAKSSSAIQAQTSSQEDTNAFARGSMAKASIATQEQTAFIPFAGRTNAFARQSVAKSSIATQGLTFSPHSPGGEDGWNPAVEQSTKLESSMRNQSGATAKNKSSPSIVPTQQEPIHHIRAQEGAEFALIGEKCQLCNIDVAFNPTGSTSSSSHNYTILPISAILPCGHCYHYDCLKGIYGSPGKGEVPRAFAVQKMQHRAKTELP